ncbi:hypothetical protein [Ralstonia pseudosolanacearum]|uniref:hypothetical protein n=1 Tax=Ralstonia pseudosolanacearum TaxID=1310165 RepID=UPI00048C0E86|nr:hypothetical protein [Ralstonia pseudosolanacearum]MDO3507972.1 hypothetical protein [Ralstonia pseudosolanacearum]MDO3513059.1 hypothetical protein [Ralstonia pseudosolanacearum]MDO3538027.1 hypothetical protein [Ralstonia pseudosolanacearum]MDO3559630.1 hypothetical protein [Ralstonia pseudosolanacearum]MDO3579321.1 hypothetical protein [Ralstonia pseudosolanacearum]
MQKKHLAALLLPLMASLSHAGEFHAPDTLVWQDRTYQLAYQSALPDGQRFYEYTTNGESVDAWTTLLTLRYGKNIQQDPTAWVVATKHALDRATPRPHCQLSVDGPSGYARILYEPTAKAPTYESDAHRSYHVGACDGLVIYQVAVKYEPAADASPKGRFERLDWIAGENAKLADALKKQAWAPRCD